MPADGEYVEISSYDDAGAVLLTKRFEFDTNDTVSAGAVAVTDYAADTDQASPAYCLYLAINTALGAYVTPGNIEAEGANRRNVPLALTDEGVSPYFTVTCSGEHVNFRPIWYSYSAETPTTVIQVAPGIYTEELCVPTNCTIQGQSRDEVIIMYPTSHSFLSELISGFISQKLPCQP